MFKSIVISYMKIDVKIKKPHSETGVVFLLPQFHPHAVKHFDDAVDI